MNVTAQQVQAFILAQVRDPARRLGIDDREIGGDFDLVGSGVVDSMRFLELLTSIEQEFGLQIDLDGVNFETITKRDGLVQIVVAASQRNG